MDIERYIRSGILELYTLGLTNNEQNQQILLMCARFPRVQDAVEDLMDDMENFQRHINEDHRALVSGFKEPATLIMPGTQTRRPPDRIYQNLEALIPGLEKHRDKYADEITLEEALAEPYTSNEEHPYEIVHDDTHQWVNKTWIWAFALISSIFLAGLIFMTIYYIKSSKASSESRKIHIEKHDKSRTAPILRP